MLFSSWVEAQLLDTSEIKSLYDRCLDFDESKADSICLSADLIEKETKRLNFDKGPVLFLRLKGICFEYQSDFNTALDYYLQSLEAAKQLGQVRYVISALNDVAMTYSYIGQPILAKKFFLQCAQLSLPEGELSTLITTYSNLGATYTQLQLYDSALVFLLRAVELGTPLGDSIDLSTTYNNIGNAYFNKKKYAEALKYFKLNSSVHLKNKELGSLWTDHLNLADVYLATGSFDSAKYHADQSMKLALELKSKSKEADSYSMLSRYYSKMGDYKRAFENMQAWYRLDTAIVNGTTQARIAEIQEQYNAKGREAENQALLREVERQNYRSGIMRILAIALGVILTIITIAFVVKRKTNKKLVANNLRISQQNEQLATLNNEKNSLIGIVSHDLGSPFATIQLWGQLLRSDAASFSAEQQKAIERMIQSARHGQDLIRNILDVEKMDAATVKLNIKEFDLVEWMKSVVHGFDALAGQKSIQLITEFVNPFIFVRTDQQLVQRILDNLLSNAIKYTGLGKKVWVTVKVDLDDVLIEVKDEGVGIEEDELPLLFNKYSKISSKPTNGEESTGLGLSIVKKLVEDLKGSIRCESKPGVGTSFIVKLKKMIE